MFHTVTCRHEVVFAFGIMGLCMENINRQDIHLLLKVRCTRLEHSQNLHDTTPHNHEHEEHDKALTYGWIIDMLPRFTNRDMSSFVNIFVEFGTSIAEATWCWLCWFDKEEEGG